MTTIPFPTTFSAQNTHRVLVQKPEVELDKLEEMTADAIAHLRAVVDAVHTLPPAERRSLPERIRDLAVYGLRGDALLPETHAAGGEVLSSIEARIAVSGGSTELQKMRDDLARAMTLGQRVFDLLLAEHRVEQLRLSWLEDLIPEEDEA